MKLVELKTKVKHDSQTFYVGERRMLDDDTAAYFIKHGWADAVESKVEERKLTPPDTAVTLEVQDGNHRSKTKVY